MDVTPIAEMSCASCGKPIDPSGYVASTDGRVWHFGCARTVARPTADLGEDGELERAREAFKAFFDEQGANVDWNEESWGEGRVLVDAVFNLDDLLRELLSRSGG